MDQLLSFFPPCESLVILMFIKKSTFPTDLRYCFRDFSGASDGKESACNAGDLDLIPGSRRSTGERNAYPLQYSLLENPMDRGPGELLSMGSQRVGSQRSQKDRATNTLACTKFSCEIECVLYFYISLPVYSYVNTILFNYTCFIICLTICFYALFSLILQ